MKISFVEQHDEKDCGAACLSMISCAYGLKLPLVKCRNILKIDNDGSSLYALIRGASEIGIDAEALEGNYEELCNEIKEKNIRFPFVARIITPELFEHYIVVYGIKNKKVFIADPAKGKMKLPEELFSEIWTGHIVNFVPGKNFKKGNETKGSLSKFFKLISNQKKLIAGIVALSLFISFVSLIGSMVFEYIVNNVVYTDKTPSDGSWFLQDMFDNLGGFCIAVIVLYVFQGIVQVVRGYFLAIMSKNIDQPLTMNFYKHMIHLPVGFFGTRKSGEILSRFSDTSNIREAISGTVLTLIIESMMALLFGIYLCYISVPLFLITLLIMVCYAIIVFCFRKPIKNINQTAMESNAQMTSYLKESIDGIETIKTFGTEKKVYEKTDSLFNKLLRIFVKGSVTYTTKDALVDTVASVGIVILLWVGNNLCSDGIISLGSLVTFYVILNYFIEPLKSLIELQPTIQTAIVAAERLNDVLELPTENSNESTELSLKGNIKFDDVTFRYGYRKAIIENLSIDIKEGLKVAIVGESGSGKTTLMNLLMSFYTPENGKITIGDKDISKLNPKDIRKRISYVSQDVFFFSDTVKNNLTMGNDSLTDEEVKKVCALAKADEFIENLPLGYDTLLSENASNLSGGQRQRLSIARALLRNPDILILDEATSNLDTITEQSIKNTIFDITKGVTTFIIAHRLSTIKNCDLILVMENGKIVESGTHDDLMERGEKYKSYWDSNM